MIVHPSKPLHILILVHVLQLALQAHLADEHKIHGPEDILQQPLLLLPQPNDHLQTHHFNILHSVHNHLVEGKRNILTNLMGVVGDVVGVADVHGEGAGEQQRYGLRGVREEEAVWGDEGALARQLVLVLFGRGCGLG